MHLFSFLVTKATCLSLSSTQFTILLMLAQDNGIKVDICIIQFLQIIWDDVKHSNEPHLNQHKTQPHSSLCIVACWPLAEFSCGTHLARDSSLMWTRYTIWPPWRLPALRWVPGHPKVPTEGKMTIHAGHPRLPMTSRTPTSSTKAASTHLSVSCPMNRPISQPFFLLSRLWLESLLRAHT